MYLNLNIFKNSQKIVTIQVATKARKTDIIEELRIEELRN